MPLTLYIKSMVCVRCKMAVEAVLQGAGIEYHAVALGWAKLKNNLTPAQKQTVVAGLKYYQLEVLEERSKILIEKIKTEIIHLLQSPGNMQFKLSVHLSELLQYNYTYLANVFSESEGITLERYFITQRVEKAKELILYEDQTLADISERLNYSSVSHFCHQFKKVTGLTPGEFKRECQKKDFVLRDL